MDECQWLSSTDHTISRLENKVRNDDFVSLTFFLDLEFETVKFKMVCCIYFTGYNFGAIPVLYFSPMVVFVLTNSANPDEMPDSVEFYLGFHCLKKCPIGGFQSTKG